jgi:hypothetical protein
MLLVVVVAVAAAGWIVVVQRRWSGYIQPEGWMDGCACLGIKLWLMV